MDPIEFGARQAVVNCVKVQKGERVVMITDRETERMADAILVHAKAAGASVQKFVMEDFGPRSVDGKSPLPFPKDINDAMSRAQASFLVAGIRPGEYQSFRQPMINAVEKHMLRHAHMVGFTEVMMHQGMAVDYAEVQELSRKVRDIVSKAHEIKVFTPAGTDLTVSPGSKSEWLCCDGNIRPGMITNLPGGEVYVVPSDANGKVVIDGCLGDSFRQYGKLQASPITYELKGGRCVRGSVRCSLKRLQKEFAKYTFETDANSNRVGEFAIGTNLGVKELIGNMLQDEKFPSVHIAMGDPADTRKVNWRSKVHLDGLMLNPTIVLDGRTTIMKDGKFVI